MIGLFILRWKELNTAMKRIFFGMLAFALIFAACLSFAGCGPAKYDSIEAFIASDEKQSEIESEEETLEGSGLSLKIVVQENKLIYNYTYDQAQDLAAAKQILKDGLDSQEEAFQSRVQELKTRVALENPIFVVRYLNPDGTELYSQEFAAE